MGRMSRLSSVTSSPAVAALVLLLAACESPPPAGGGEDAAHGGVDAAAASNDASTLPIDAAAVPADSGVSADAGLASDASFATAPDAQVQADGSASAIDAAAVASADAAETVDAAGTPDAAEPPDAAAPTPGPDASLRPFAVEGFGRFTVGGWQPGFSTYEVTSFDDDGPGTLREGLRTNDQPRVITFASDGTINLANSLLVPSNVSIDGRGHQVVVKNRGFILAGTDEVILTNLAIEDVTSTSEDGVRIGDPTLGPSERVVLDHLRFTATGDLGDSAKTDEAISVIFGSRDITFAYLKFDNWEKAMLFGNGDASAAVDSELRVTVHHTLAKVTGRRHPQARYGIFDFYSCFFDDWRMYGWLWEKPYRESFGMQSQDGAHILAESILFRRSSHTYDLGSQANDATRCESGGVLEGKNLAVAPGGNAALRFGVGCATNPAPWTRPYPATVDAADATLQSRLEAEAGNTL
ncbi:MAG: hypothetical protein QM765_16840 [Myxococcales bacterium]